MLFYVTLLLPYQKSISKITNERVSTLQHRSSLESDSLKSRFLQLKLTYITSSHVSISFVMQLETCFYFFMCCYSNRFFFSISQWECAVFRHQTSSLSLVWSREELVSDSADGWWTRSSLWFDWLKKQSNTADIQQGGWRKKNLDLEWHLKLIIFGKNFHLKFRTF